MRLADVALAGSCAAFVLVPTVGQRLSDGEGYGEGPQSPLQPPGFAFGIWFPIFALAATDTVARLRDPRPDDEPTRWPLAAAYAGNTAWALLAQTGRHRATPVALTAAATSGAVAVRRLAGGGAGRGAGRGTTSWTAGLLLGWTTLASAINVSAEARRGAADADGGRADALDVVALTAAGAALVALLRDQPPGGAAATTSATWGLATTALTPSRPGVVRAIAGALGATLVGLAARRR